MLLLLLIWCYIFATGFHFGIVLSNGLRLAVKDTVTLIFMGLLSVMCMASVWAIFGRINWEFHLFLLLLNGGMYLLNRSSIINHYRNFIDQLKALSKPKRLYLALAALVFALVCSAPCSFADNEIYYIQTIKWLNEYGFVKGLANLHLYFGQCSGWHILQSVFNFSFTGFGSNSLNGFCLLLGNLFALLQSDSFKPAAYFPLANMLLFPFIAVPSPDLAVVVLAFVLFCHFVKSFDDCSAQQANLMAILAVCIVYIKITALPILLLPLALWIRHFKLLAPRMVFAYAIGALVLVLFVVKNTLLTGYPLFPTVAFEKLTAANYALPEEIHAFSFNAARRFDFFVSQQAFATMGNVQLFFKWLLFSGWASVCNLAIILLFVLIPMTKAFTEKGYRLLYAFMVLQLIFVWIISPQYRFMLHFMVFFGLVLFSAFVTQSKMVAALPLLSIGLVFCLCFAPILSSWQSTAINFKPSRWQAKNLLLPNGNSNLYTHYHRIQTGNLHYFSPDKKTYIWATGNGELPCVNQTQLQYLKYKVGYIPQLRTQNLKDGFYSAKAKLP